MSDQPSKTGLYVSGAMHSALLAFIVFGFASAPKFEDAPESIPVDTITQSQFNEIMKGENNAKPAKEAPAAPTTPQAAVEPPAVPTPPPPPPELNKADEPTPVPAAQARAAAAQSRRRRTRRRPPVKPKEPPPEKFKPDAVAKFLEKAKPDEPADREAYDPNAIAKLLETRASSRPIRPRPARRAAGAAQPARAAHVGDA